MNQDKPIDLAIICMTFLCMFIFCIVYMPVIVRWFYG